MTIGTSYGTASRGYRRDAPLDIRTSRFPWTLVLASLEIPSRPPGESLVFPPSRFRLVCSRCHFSLGTVSSMPLVTASGFLITRRFAS
jgi:hypothetical protein